MPLILGIESSCDETSAAVVKDGSEVKSNIIASQIAKHAEYGGVVPELAAREHLTAIKHVVAEALSSSGTTMKDMDSIAVTMGPGLMPALLIGVNFAKGLAASNKLPIIGVDHFIAHIYGTFLDTDINILRDPSIYPLLALVVSGGHSALVLVTADGKARMIGTTIDDAAGEAFDKAAKLLGLGYPGGPVIEKTAKEGNPSKYHFPRSLTGATGKGLDEKNLFNFSFSGVKTSLLYHCKKLGGAENMDVQTMHDTVASYQEAIVDVLCMKAFDAAKHFGAKSLVLAGGVACNNPLRERLEKTIPDKIKLFLAAKKYCTDNAAMVAGLAYHFHRQNKFHKLDFDPYARLPEITEIPFLM